MVCIDGCRAFRRLGYTQAARLLAFPAELYELLS